MMSDEHSSQHPNHGRESMPRWVWKAVAIFWFGAVGALAVRELWADLQPFFVLILVSLFLSFAIEPAANRLARRGWRRGTATGVLLFGVLIMFAVLVGAIVSLVGQQIAELLGNSEKYVNRTVDFLNGNFGTHINADQVIESINDPQGPLQRFIKSQQRRVVEVSVAALGMLLQVLSVMLFTFYLVADGPKLRRAICSRLRPERQRRVLDAWDLAIEKTGGYLYSRALLALISALFHWVVLAALGVKAALALALWVGVVSQFLPVIGTYIAGALPVLITFIDSPAKALGVLVVVIVYQQLENYLFLPRITARTMNLHPAVAFGAAIAGAAVLGAVGAILAIPGAAMAQAFLNDTGARHEVIESTLTTEPTRRRSRRRSQKRTGTDATGATATGSDATGSDATGSDGAT